MDAQTNKTLMESFGAQQKQLKLTITLVPKAILVFVQMTAKSLMECLQVKQKSRCQDLAFQKCGVNLMAACRWQYCKRHMSKVAS